MKPKKKSWKDLESEESKRLRKQEKLLGLRPLIWDDNSIKELQTKKL